MTTHTTKLLLILCTFICIYATLILPSNANIGFEYEIGHMASWTTLWEYFGTYYRQKPLGTGLGGWWDMQLDVAGPQHAIEFVVPPSRMFRGIPLHSNLLLQKQVCPSLLQLEEYLQLTTDVVQQDTPMTPQTSIFGYPVPGQFISGSPLHLSFDTFGRVQETELAGRLQMTIGMPLRDLFGFVEATMDHQDIFYGRGGKDAIAIVPMVRALGLSEEVNALLLVLGLVYVEARFLQRDAVALSYFKQLTVLLVRTDLSRVYADLSAESRKSLSALAMLQSDSDEQVGKSESEQEIQGMVQLIRKLCVDVLVDSFSEEQAQERCSDNFFPIEFRNGDTFHQSDTLQSVCSDLVHGKDPFSHFDRSIGAQPYKGELVVEFRRVADPSIHSQAMNWMRNLILFAKLFTEKGSDGKQMLSEFDFEGTQGLEFCDSENEKSLSRSDSDSENTKLWFSFKTLLEWENGGETAKLFGTPFDGKALGSGPFAWWGTFLESNRLKFQIPSPTLHPEGVGKLLYRESEIVQSLQQLDMFLGYIDNLLVYAGDIVIGIPGVITDRVVPVLWHSPSPMLSGKLEVVSELSSGDAIAFIQHVLDMDSVVIGNTMEWRRLMSVLEGMSVSPLFSLLVVYLCAYSSEQNGIHVSLDASVLLGRLTAGERHEFSSSVVSILSGSALFTQSNEFSEQLTLLLEGSQPSFSVPPFVETDTYSANRVQISLNGECRTGAQVSSTIRRIRNLVQTPISSPVVVVKSASVPLLRPNVIRPVATRPIVLPSNPNV